jgi:hypothetical protein
VADPDSHGRRQAPAEHRKRRPIDGTGCTRAPHAVKPKHVLVCARLRASMGARWGQLARPWTRISPKCHEAFGKGVGAGRRREAKAAGQFPYEMGTRSWKVATQKEVAPSPLDQSLWSQSRKGGGVREGGWGGAPRLPSPAPPSHVGLAGAASWPTDRIRHAFSRSRTRSVGSGRHGLRLRSHEAWAASRLRKDLRGNPACRQVVHMPSLRSGCRLTQILGFPCDCLALRRPQCIRNALFANLSPQAG